MASSSEKFRADLEMKIKGKFHRKFLPIHFLVLAIHDKMNGRNKVLHN